MALLIDAFQRTDQSLAASVSASIEPVLLLERVEAGSIRARLITLLREINDDALQTLDWKPLVGQYLVRAKHKMLRWLEDHPEVSSRGDVLELQQELMSDRPQLPSNQLLLPSPVPPAILLGDIRTLSEALVELQPGDSARYISDEESTLISAPRGLSNERIEELLTQEVIVSETEALLLVKKPDYLGNSRWEFRLDDRTIEAKVLDEAWLRRFQSGGIALRPGDALRALVRAEAYRGFEGHLVATKYHLLEVRAVVHQQEDGQADLMP
ncbi:MAG: hypothetical protein NW201_06755 [Gemmatimonadales bacterium]|nr:hypothetical protein [Gemmatimonadales bacterium]